VGFESADRVQDAEGRQYHVGLAPGEVAPWILLVGDPARAARLAEQRMGAVRVERRHREFVTFTGTIGEREVTVMGTGIGCDNTEIAVMELLQCERRPTFLRVGSCGGLQPGMEIGDLVVTTGAMRLESTSLGFVDEAYPAVAHHEVVLALVSSARRQGARCHTGITATASGFYGWQGRRGQIVEPRFPDLPERLGRMGVANFEMEASTLLTLASLAGCRAGAVCTVFANRPENRFIDPERKAEAEDRAVAVGLDAFEVLARMDAKAGGGPFHLEV